MQHGSFGLLDICIYITNTNLMLRVQIIALSQKSTPKQHDESAAAQNETRKNTRRDATDTKYQTTGSFS